jgi:hypothetical protein
MSNTYRGVGLHFGVNSTTAYVVSGTLRTQSRDHNLKAEKEQVRDGDGTTVGIVYYDPSEEATFEFIPTSSGVSGTLNPSNSLSAIGSMGTVTDSVYTAIAGTNWIVDDVSTKGSNTSALRVTLKLIRFASVIV